MSLVTRSGRWCHPCEICARIIHLRFSLHTHTHMCGQDCIALTIENRRQVLRGICLSNNDPRAHVTDTVMMTDDRQSHRKVVITSPPRYW